MTWGPARAPPCDPTSPQYLMLRALGKEPDAVSVRAAAGLTLLFRALRVLDDVQDDDLRGELAQQGRGIASNCGATLLFASTQAIRDVEGSLPTAAATALRDALHHHGMRLARGQHRDLANRAATVSQAREIAIEKSAFFALTIEVAAIGAGQADEGPLCPAYRVIGNAMAEVHQLVDDIADLTERRRPNASNVAFAALVAAQTAPPRDDDPEQLRRRVFESGAEGTVAGLAEAARMRMQHALSWTPCDGPYLALLWAWVDEVTTGLYVPPPRDRCIESIDPASLSPADRELHTILVAKRRARRSPCCAPPHRAPLPLKTAKTKRRTRDRSPEFELAADFVLRTPLLPLATFTALADGCAVAEVGFEDHCATLRTRLRAIVERPVVQDALSIASGTLLREVGRWLVDPSRPDAGQVERTLVRYIARMSGRATPFGLFSGVTPGRVGPRTRLEPASSAAYERHTRLDSDYLLALGQAVNSRAGFRASSKFFVNSSLVRAGGRIRVVETRQSGRVREHHLTAVECTPHLEAALGAAATGARANTIAAAIVTANASVSVTQARRFVEALVDAQILVSRIGPNVTGAPPAATMLERLNEDPSTVPEARGLAQICAQLTAIDQAGLAAPVGRYEPVFEAMTALGVPFDRARSLQVDLVKPAANVCLGPAVVDEIERGIDLLQSLTRERVDAGLERFRRDFLARYGDREVPLAEALDEESGIGFGTQPASVAGGPEILSGLALPGLSPNSPAAVVWDPARARLMRLLCTCLQHGERCIELSDDDVLALRPPRAGRLPDAVATTVQVISASHQTLDDGEFRVVLGPVGGPSGARLAGRFCHASAAIERGVRDHLAAEEALQPDAVFAEVVHLPQGRTGNVLCRPVLRKYEIPYLGDSGASESAKIPLQDLVVSVRGDRVVLRSQRLDREVLPRITTAHNYEAPGLGPYRFLGALQTQGSTGAHWSWGPLADAPFLPRIQRGRLILSRARWQLDRHQIAMLADAAGGAKSATTPEQRMALRRRVFGAVQGLKERLQLPRRLVLADGDNELPIDLDNAWSVDSFVQLVKARPAAILYEWLEHPSMLVAGGPEGGLVHQINVMATRRRPRESASMDPAPTKSRRATAPRAMLPPRRYALGSQWLYAKIYCGPATADDVLRQIVAPLCRRAVQDNVAERWFFVRYGDPEWHLRVRLQGDPHRMLREFVPPLHDRLEQAMSAEVVSRVEFDTYQPEARRYGGDEGLRLAEAIFGHDSECAAKIVEHYRGDEGLDARWKLALVGTDQLLESAGLELEAKRALMAASAAGLAREGGADARTRRNLGTKFRIHRGVLEALVHPRPGVPVDPFFAPGLHALSERSHAIGVSARRLGGAPSVVSSVVHMSANRVLRSAARAQELWIYDALRRLYTSRLARKRRPVP